jgi:hypothetical protein
MYQTDVLEILDILLKLGVRDSRMQEAVELISSKQDTSGRWALENSYRGSLDYAEGTTGCDCMAHRRRSSLSALAIW